MASVDYSRQRSQWLKAHGICVTCGNANAEPGRTRCRKCLDKCAEAAKRWRDRHPDYMREYYYTHPGQWRGWASRKELQGGAGRQKVKQSHIRKPDGTCHRKGCWESALPFSCWCATHKKEMEERRCLKAYLSANESANTEKCSPLPK